MARFNPPPGWPITPGWAPPVGWAPDPSWPRPPAGWTWWLPDLPVAPAPSNAVIAQRWLLGAPGLIVVIGSLLPWATAFGGLIGVYGTRGDGIITLVLGVLIIAGGLAFALTPPRIWLPIVTGLLGLAVVVVAVIDIANIQSDSSANPGLVSTGPGLWLTLVGGVLAVVVALSGTALARQLATAGTR